MVALVGALDRDADVGGLLGLELREFDTEGVEMEAGEQAERGRRFPLSTRRGRAATTRASPATSPTQYLAETAAFHAKRIALFVQSGTEAATPAARRLRRAVVTKQAVQAVPWL
jgi:hypothetical protein